MQEQRHWKWLTGKIPGWIEKGILNPDQAEQLLNEAPQDHRKHNLLTRILISISALLFGLGVISFFAFNWQVMPKWLKLATIFSVFITAHVAGFLLARDPLRKTLSEFFHLLGTMFFGAGIMLIAQIYHIDEHLPNGVLLWSLGALLMAYILNSTPQLLLYSALTVAWQAMERSYHVPQLWAVFFATAALIPLTIHKKHWFAVSITTVTLIIVIALQLSFYRIGLNGNLFFLGVMCLGAALLIRRTGHSSCAVPLEVTGYILYFCMLITFTFAGGVKAGLIKDWSQVEISNAVFPAFIAIITVLIWISFCFPFHSFFDRYRQMQNRHLFLAFFGFMAALVIWVVSKTAPSVDFRSDLALAGMIFFNVLALVQGIALIFSGTRAGQIGKSFIGCLLVVTIILSRFADYSDDLLMRSISFTIGGAFILWIAVKTSKIKKEMVKDAQA